VLTEPIAAESVQSKLSLVEMLGKSELTLNAPIQYGCFYSTGFGTAYFIDGKASGGDFNNMTEFDWTLGFSPDLQEGIEGANLWIE